MGLFTPAWKSKDREEVKKAIWKTTDIKKLKEIAKHAETIANTFKQGGNSGYNHYQWRDISSYAIKEITDKIENITNPKELIKIARTDEFKEAREAATKRITDANVLIEIAKTDEDGWVRRAAVEMINNQNVLIEIAKTDKSASVREVAIKKIIDQNALIEIAKTDTDNGVCEAAIRMITDQNVLIEVAKTDKNSNVREAAIKKITDQNALIEIAKTDTDNGVCEAAIRMITDQNALIEIAKTDTDNGVCEAAIRMITDPHLMKQLLLYCYPKTRLYEAINKALNHRLPENIAQILNKEEHEWLKNKFTYEKKVIGGEHYSTDCGNEGYRSDTIIKSGLYFPPFKG